MQNAEFINLKLAISNAKFFCGDVYQVVQTGKI